MIDSLLRFSKVEPPRFELLDVNSILENALILVRKQLSDTNIKLITNFNQQIPNIMGDTSQLWQVFVNIIINAIQAMPKGGKLQINTGYSRDQIFISFTDTGVGIDKEDLSKIFNPFFTTKDMGT
ncbi:MAG TPA: ATP-binding protein, partial [Thermodesulfobacteriota bacterium]|nr:ATP-binding protein [Thermodesulfobacteriota bacterium]